MAEKHLPECESDEFKSWQIEECICDRLRACEQRVDARWLAKSPLAVAYVAGLSAARDAVAVLPGVTPDDLTWQEVLAAIDALKGGSDA